MRVLFAYMFEVEISDSESATEIKFFTTLLTEEWEHARAPEYDITYPLCTK